MNENIFLVFAPNTLNLFEQYKKYQIEIDPFIKRIKNCEEERNSLNTELEYIMQNKKNILDEINNMCIEGNDTNEQGNNELSEELNDIQRKERKIMEQLVKLKNLINILHRKNPLNNLEKYDKLFVLYINKLHILSNFIKKISLKFYDYYKKHPIYKL